MAQTTDLGIERTFTKPKSKGYEALKWTKRDSVLMNPQTGKAVFEQYGVEFPEGWSQNAINIVAQKYFTGTPGTSERESSLKHLIDRVVDTVTRQGVQEVTLPIRRKKPKRPRISAKSLSTFWQPSGQLSTHRFGLTSAHRNGPSRLALVLF